LHREPPFQTHRSSKGAPQLDEVAQDDSGSGNGPFGLGWQLAIPSISRKTDKGLPRYETSDALLQAGIPGQPHDVLDAGPLQEAQPPRAREAAIQADAPRGPREGAAQGPEPHRSRPIAPRPAGALPGRSTIPTRHWIGSSSKVRVATSGR
jgi:Salmonella virulence plasmid 65kDa B protein